MSKKSPLAPKRFPAVPAVAGVELAGGLVGVDRLLHHIGSTLTGVDTVVVRDRLSPGCLDFVHHIVGHGVPAAGSIPGASEVIDHHLGAPLAKLQRIGLSQAPSGARNNRNSSRVIDLRHVIPP